MIQNPELTYHAIFFCWWEDVRIPWGNPYRHTERTGKIHTKRPQESFKYIFFLLVGCSTFWSESLPAIISTYSWNNEQQVSIYFHASTCLFPSLEANWASSQTEKVRQTSSCHAKHPGLWLLDIQSLTLTSLFLVWRTLTTAPVPFAHLVISTWVFLKGVWVWGGSDPVHVSDVIFSIPAGTVWHSSATQIRNDCWVTDEWRTLCVTWMHFPSLFLFCFTSSSYKFC